MNEADVLIVGRGGGSMEDLWAFNEEAVARSVYESKIPVISAVGHEIDWTICDLAADLRAPTPSAAAELVVQNRAELENRLTEYKARIKNEILSLIEAKKKVLTALQASYAFKQPLLLIDEFSQRLDEQMRQLQNYLKAFMSQKRQAFQGFTGRLHALSPLSILERGYSISFDSEGNLLKNVGRVQVGDALVSKLWQGILHSKITRIEKHQEKTHGLNHPV